MTSVGTRRATLLLAVALLLSACDRAGTDPDGTNSPTTPNGNSADEQVDLDGAMAAELVMARFDAVYGLPPISPDDVDVDSAGDGVVALGSTEAERIAGALNQAIELGVLDRGDVLVEALEPPQPVGEDSASASLCMSQDIRTTDLETGEDSGAPAPPDDWLAIQTVYERVNGAWLVAEITAADPANCVPPSIVDTTGHAWGVFADGRLDHERRGGGPDIGDMEAVVTERFAETLRSIGPFEPPASEPPGYTDFLLAHATRSTAEGQACRDGELETVEWQLVSGEWLIDFAGQEGEEARPCP